MTNKEAKSIFFFEANTKENRNEHYREACKLAYVALDRMEKLEQEETRLAHLITEENEIMKTEKKY